MGQSDLWQCLRDGQLSVKVTPKSGAHRIVIDGGQLRVYVTAVPEAGKANAAVQKLLAKELGLAKSKLRLIRGQTSRDKVFQIDG